jgi:hypothetical protein
MATVTLDQALSNFESLPADDQRLFAELIRKRQIESWRDEVAAQAKKDLKDLRDGKLKAESARDIMKRVRSLSQSTQD